MGPKAQIYYCSGALIASIIYFLFRREWGRKNVERSGILDQGSRGKRKVLFRTWDNKCDWMAVFMLLVGAAIQTSIFLSIVLCYATAINSGLNIGIAQAIWAINPFLTGIIERIIYGTKLNLK